MRLFVGLGNPGSDYLSNRHNLGFVAVNALADRYNVSSWRSKFQGLIAEGRLGNNKVTFFKPMTFMNESGRAVKELITFYKTDLDNVLVFFDEIELAPGKIRVKKSGGHAGHNGIRSLISHIGGDFWRVRMGVGHPGKKDLVSGYVLQDFTKSDSKWVDALVNATVDAAPLLIEGDHNRFMTNVARDMASIETPLSPRDALKQRDND